jgi:hypothetical protein
MVCLAALDAGRKPGFDDIFTPTFPRALLRASVEDKPKLEGLMPSPPARLGPARCARGAARLRRARRTVAAGYTGSMTQIRSVQPDVQPHPTRGTLASNPQKEPTTTDSSLQRHGRHELSSRATASGGV